MKFQAIITVHIDATDIYDVEAERERLAQLTRQLKSEYADALLEMKARRPRTPVHRAMPPKLASGYEVVRVRRVA